jgi:aminoglycoside phosphotransferase (APT) family kinase protein
LRGAPKDISPVEILLLRSSIPDYVVGHTEHVDCNRPVLFHDDIHPGNIIIDGDKLHGYRASFSGILTFRIIDWDMVYLVPLETAIKLPTFLSKTMFTDPPWVVTDADRELYIQAFRKCELAKSTSEGTPLTNLLETSSRRAYFHEAFHSLAVHQKWFEEHGHGRKPAQQLLHELDDFSMSNSKNLGVLDEEVLKLRATIERAQ